MGVTHGNKELTKAWTLAGSTSAEAKESIIGRALQGRKADRTIPMDFIVLTPEQYERQKNIVGTIARQAEREGKVIYDHAA